MSNVLSATIPTFKINEVTLPIPSNFKWELPKVWGIDGSGNERLAPFTSVELSWGTLSYLDYTTLYEVYKGSSSGSATATLPSFYGSTFTYQHYSGIIIDIPRIEGANIDGSNLSNVKMTIRKVTISRVP